MEATRRMRSSVRRESPDRPTNAAAVDRYRYDDSAGYRSPSSLAGILAATFPIGRSVARRWLLLLGAAVVIGAPLGEADAQITARQVREAISNGAAFLKNRQDTNGSWIEWGAGQDGGITALVTLALLESGIAPDDPTIERALEFLRSIGAERRHVYSTSLVTMALCRARPDKDLPLIREHVRWLENVQARQGADEGGWSYGEVGRADNSNSQFALLALHEAVQVGAEVDPEVWERASRYWLTGQHSSGGWGYVAGDPPSGSMTCAGISSVIIIDENRRRTAPASIRDLDCCGGSSEGEALERALAYWGTRFSARRNPTAPNDIGDSYLYYYLYGVERAGRLSARRFFGDHDWYREAGEHLLSLQKQVTGGWIGVQNNPAEKVPEIATSFALLFLSKGRWPVVAAKYRHGSGNAWDAHPQGMTFLVRDVERAWKTKLTWQVIEGERAELNDLLESPVLMISGRDSLPIGAEQRRLLREYVEQGGFIFAWADASPGCDAAGFDTEFRALVAELFPDSPLQVLPPDHPIWSSDKPLLPNPDRPLLGVQACCRTSIVYCPSDLACAWRWSQPTRLRQLSDEVRREVGDTIQLGINVLTYATGRQLREKLDRPQVVETPDERSRFRLEIPKLAHGGGADEAAAAWNNLLREASAWLDQPIETSRSPIAADDPALPAFPLVFLHGRRDFVWNESERESIGRFLSGEIQGFLFADAICGSDAFAAALRRELSAAVPAGRWELLPADHPLLGRSTRGFDLTAVTLRRPDRNAAGGATVRESKTAAVLEGFFLDGRLVAVLSPYDLSCAWENGSSLECVGYSPEDARRIGINVLLYALQE